MIEMFEILNNFDKIDPEVLLEVNNVTVTRCNGMKSKVRRCNTNALKSHFNVRLSTIGTHSSVVSSKTIGSFKSQLDIYFNILFNN